MEIDLAQLEFVDPKLREMALDIERTFGKRTITSLYRIDDDGVHGQLPLRGIDFRCRLIILGNLIKKYVDERWAYDYKRPNKTCCKVHGKGKNFHIHLQTHPNTTRRF